MAHTLHPQCAFESSPLDNFIKCSFHGVLLPFPQKSLPNSTKKSMDFGSIAEAVRGIPTSSLLKSLNSSYCVLENSKNSLCHKI